MSVHPHEEYQMETFRLGAFSFYVDDGGGLRTADTNRLVDLDGIREDVNPVSVNMEAIRYTARVLDTWITADDVRRIVHDADARGL